MADQTVDVCIAGAGAAGMACAQGLVRQGHSVVLLERLDPMPDCLKAEKIGGEAVQSLLRLGFKPAVDAALTPLHNVAVSFGERTLGTVPNDPPEAGALYHVLINNLRRNLDPRIDFKTGVKAVSFEQQPGGMEVITDKGTHIACRLAVLATGDARQLIEALGGSYEPQMPYNVFAAAFNLEGQLVAGGRPVDSQTFHHPVPGAPIAYATFFRLGSALRANVFCPGEVPDTWQRDLKQRPLEALSAHNNLLGAAARQWRVTSPVITRKVHVARLSAPDVPHLVVLGDAAHTIDPGGGGGMVFALTEVELLLEAYLPRWLGDEAPTVAAIRAFYDDPRRLAAINYFFGRGKYIFALNNDSSLRGRWRRTRFALDQRLAARHGSAPQPQHAGPAWQMPAGNLYEQFAPGQR